MAAGEYNHGPLMSLAGILLAAGKGTRMKSDMPKGLHRVCGVPMVEQIGREMKAAGIAKPVVIVGHGGDEMVKTLGEGYDFAWQREQKGTGHAALMAAEFFHEPSGYVIVAPGDTPLINACLFKALAEECATSQAQCAMAVAVLEDPRGYGRVVFDSEGPKQIIEDKDCTDEQRKTLTTVNAGIYCFEAKTLFEILPTLGNENAQGEYYITDVPALIRRQGGKVVAHDPGDANILLGVNDRWQLAQCAKLLRQEILKKHALNGVTIVDPDSTYIERDVEIGVDTMLEPGTILEGRTKIGKACHIGPNTKIKHSEIGDRVTILMSHLERAKMADDSRCGPYANLRPGAILAEQVKIGNFVEIKNAKLGPKVSASHLSYIGDGEVGAGTNIGAGTIFCNYDGFLKHRTEIGADVFIGSNSTLVAPVTIGDGAIIAAGSVITHSVDKDALALGRARQEDKKEWAPSWKDRKRAEKEERSK